MRTILWILGFTAAAVFIGIFVTLAFGLLAFKVASPYIACGIIGLYIVLRIIPRHMQR
jgi:L-cystine uptake protein TcyP (sodium:dicarboxylate symporter family)